jgi:hypothetical protein
MRDASDRGHEEEGMWDETRTTTVHMIINSEHDDQQ